MIKELKPFRYTKYSFRLQTPFYTLPTDIMLRQTSEPLLTADNMNSGAKLNYADSFLDNDTTYSTNCNNCSQDDTILSVKRFDRASKRFEDIHLGIF